MPKAYHRPAYDRGRKDSARATRERARIREASEALTYGRPEEARAFVTVERVLACIAKLDAERGR